MYCQIFQFNARPGRREDFLRGSKQHAEDCMREEPGTVAFHFVQDEEDENRFYLFESYADRAAHQAHVQGPIMQRNAPQLIPMLISRPALLGRGFEFYSSDAP